MLYETEEIMIENKVLEQYYSLHHSETDKMGALFPEFIKKGEEYDIKKGELLIQNLSRILLDFVINENVLLNFHEMFYILTLKILENRSIFLADIPLNYYKLFIAKSMPLVEMEKMLTETFSSMKSFGFKKGISDVFFMLYGHVLQIPRDIYLYDLLMRIRETEKEKEILLFVEMPQFDSFFQFYKITKKAKSNLIGISSLEKIEHLIEKLSILEILFESHADKSKNVNTKMLNFLENNLKDLNVKEAFNVSLEKYSAIRKEFIN